MALARTDLLQAISGTAGTFGVGSFTTGSFTPPSNSLLVVSVGYIENNGSTTDPASALTISGGGWTYSSPVSVTASPTSFPSTVKIWTAPVGTGASMTLTLGSGGRTAAFYAVSVVAYTGYDTGTSTGATATGIQTSGFTGPPSPASITLGAAPSSTSEVVAAVAMDKSVLGVTPGSSPTVWTEVHDNMENTDWGGLETEIRGGNASTSVSWDDLRSGGGGLFNFAAAAVEIRAAVAAAAAFVPLQPARRRLAVPRARPRTPVRAQDNSPAPFAAAKPSRRLRGFLPRRGKSFTPVPAQVVVAPPAFVPAAVRARLKGLRLFRGRTAAAPVDQPAAFQSQRPRLRLPRFFRGRAAAPVPAQVVVAAPGYPPQAVRTRLRGLRLFRGRTAAPVPAQVVVQPPAYPPQNVRTRLKGLRLFRGRSATPVAGQVVIAAPAFVPLAVRARLKGLLSRRPRPAGPPVDQAVPTAAVHERPHGIAPRRGRAVMPPPPQATVAAPAYSNIRPRLKGLRSWRGREAATPVPAQVVVAPPAYPPGLTRAKKRVARILRGVARFVPFTDATPTVQPRTPTVSVDLARAAVTADLSRTTAIADLTRPSVTVAL